MSDLSQPNVPKTNQNAKAPEGVNNSFDWQKPGSSINALAKGVVSDTMTSINDSDLMHACSLKPDTLKTIYMGTLTKVFGIEAQRATDLATWAGESVSPIIEAVKKVKDIIDWLNTQIKQVIDFIKYVMKEIQQFIEAIMEVITFIMSLPAELLKLVQSCLDSFNQMVSTVKQSVTDVYNSTAGAIQQSVNGLQSSTQTLTSTGSSVTSTIKPVSL